MKRQPPAAQYRFLTHRGLEVLAAAEGVPPLRYAEHAGLAVETSAKGRGGNRLRNLRRNFAHTLGVNHVFISLTRTARRCGHHAPYWWSESEATTPFDLDGDRYWIRPDGSGCYYLGEERRHFLLEYDRGTMRRRDYMRKLRGLAAYFLSEKAEREYGAGLVVLVVSETDHGERRFAEAVRLAETFWDVSLPVLLTTRERMDGRWLGMLGPIWRTPTEERRRNWLGEIATPRA
ncbi:MAG: replication-relaxation family protein [Dehalococcoidia bacterium]